MIGLVQMLMINASNLYVGGGVQVAVSVIEELTECDLLFIAAVSPRVWDQLSYNSRGKSILIEESPSGPLNFKTRRILDNIVSDYKVTHVFTIFGPSYWSPDKSLVQRHMVGFALPWLIYDISNIISTLTYREKLKFLLLRSLQPFFYKKNADIVITETEDVSSRVEKLLNFKKDRVFTVSNTLNSIFKSKNLYDESILKKLPIKDDNDFWLLTISHNYSHKNLKVIKELVKILPENYKFITTLEAEFINDISVENQGRVFTLGSVSLAQCPPLYYYSDALFLPTLLECFSTSYLEAMQTNKVILTSNLSFAHTVCGEAAIYFDPYDVNDIADAVISAHENKVVYYDKVEKGRERLEAFPDAKSRAKQYIDILTNDIID